MWDNTSAMEDGYGRKGGTRDTTAGRAACADCTTKSAPVWLFCLVGCDVPHASRTLACFRGDCSPLGGEKWGTLLHFANSISFTTKSTAPSCHSLGTDLAAKNLPFSICHT